MKRNGDWMSTYSGGKFWPCDPQASEVSITDIAHHLSLVNRFTGATRVAYSVAQHSVLCSRIVPPEDALWGLLHDASEAYLTDVSRPVKPFLTNYKTLETRLMRCIADRFGLTWPMPQSVHDADNVLVCTERRDLLNPGPDWGAWCKNVPLLFDTIVPMQAPAAERAFLAAFEKLSGGMT